jgi:glycosyltransferase involved in cell wall biosynthesis
MADHLAGHGIYTLVSYPKFAGPPRTLQNSAAQPVELGVSLDDPRWVDAMLRLVKQQNVRVIYFTDFAVRHWAYRHFRRNGVRRIIVHDHTSGARTPRTGLLRWLKWAYMRVPGTLADTVVAVSDYVAARHQHVGLVPPERIVRIWNGLPVSIPDPKAAVCVRQMFQIPAERPLLVCTCRASPEKGVAHLFRAYDRLSRQMPPSGKLPVLIFVGGGPQLAELSALRDSLVSRQDILLTGYRPDAKLFLEAADLCIAPSVWQEAFPLAVLEAMAMGKPVIATSVGGVPEMIRHDVTGFLVPPGNEEALCEALQLLLSDPKRAARLGCEAQRAVAELFTPAEQLRQMTALVEEGFGQPCAEVSPSPHQKSASFRNN